MGIAHSFHSPRRDVPLDPSGSIRKPTILAKIAPITNVMGRYRRKGTVTKAIPLAPAIYVTATATRNEPNAPVLCEDFAT
jgi:hypothetical protein